MSEQSYTIGKLRGELALVFYGGGKRHRHTLGTADPSEAKRIAPALYAELTKPRGSAVSDLWEAYVTAHAGRRIAVNMAFSWKALKDRFGPLPGDCITLADCKAHAAERRKNNIKDGTIYTELNHLRIVLRWAEKNELLSRASRIERPPQPRAREDYLTRLQVTALIASAPMPHIALYIKLAIATGARNGAILDLTWDRVDLERGLIDLRTHDLARTAKGRAIVPMNNMLRAALEQAKPNARCEHVVEWGGARVASVKKGLHSAAKAASIDKVWPHLLRHSAAVHMAEAGITMDEIAQFLGHDNVETTRKIYARYSPEYLRRAASALEY